MRLAQSHPEWVLGYADEVWWSRLAQPPVQSWTDGEPLRLEELSAERTDPDPKALACYGLLRADTEKIWLRFVAGRPVSAITLGFLVWVMEKLRQEGKKALLLVWDNASWHISRAVRNGIRAHNRRAKQEGGVRILVCQLPTKSPWLNRIEPHWSHGKRAVVEPTRKLTAGELIARVCSYYGCEHLSHLSK
jgi:hypothetical protein